MTDASEQSPKATARSRILRGRRSDSDGPHIQSLQMRDRGPELERTNEKPHSNTAPAPATFDHMVPPEHSFLSCFKTTLCCNLGYNMNFAQRELNLNFKGREDRPLYSVDRSEGYSLGTKIEGIECCASELMGMIKPYVRIHAVNVHSGKYVRGSKRTATAPIDTSPYAVRDSCDVPSWQEEVVLSARYSDIVSEDTLLLFEVLDNRPSLMLKKGKGFSRGGQGVRPPKQIAWGYLLPVGVCGALNVGIRDTWLHKKNNLKSKLRSGSRDLEPEDSGEENETGNKKDDTNGNRNKGRERLHTERAKRLARIKRNEESEGRNSGEENSENENEDNDDVGGGVGGGTVDRTNSRFRDRDRDGEESDRDDDNENDENDDDNGDDDDDDGGASKGDRTSLLSSRQRQTNRHRSPRMLRNRSRSRSHSDGDSGEAEHENGNGIAARSGTQAKAQSQSKSRGTRLSSQSIQSGASTVLTTAQRAKERACQRVQLFSYCLSDGVLGLFQRSVMGWPALKATTSSSSSKSGRGPPPSYLDGIPSVYLQWRMQRKQPIKFGILNVVLGPRRTEYTSLQAYPVGAVGNNGLGSVSASESERERERDKGKDRSGDGDDAESPTRAQTRKSRLAAQSQGQGGKEHTQHAHRTLPISKAERAKVARASARRVRAAKEPCVVTDKLLHRLDVGPEGAMVVSFSSSGHLLAVACRSASSGVPFSADSTTSPCPNSTYALKLYDTDIGSVVWSQTYAHHGVIYDLKWSKDDSYIVTASSDGTTKIWDVLSLTPSWIGPRNLDRSDSSPLRQDGMDEKESISRSRSTSLHKRDREREGDRDRSREERDRDREGSEEGSQFEGASADGWPSSHKRYPHLAYTLSPSPPVFVYCATFQELSSPFALHGLVGFCQIGGVDLSRDGPPEQNTNTTRTAPPRVITGSSDGRIRVWDGAVLTGKIRVEKSDAPHSESAHEEDFAPHEGSVQVLTIDDRTRYLLSGDSVGDIFLWRTDSHGWYELLRRLKRDLPIDTRVPPPIPRPSVGRSFLGTNPGVGVGLGGQTRGGTLGRSFAGTLNRTGSVSALSRNGNGGASVVGSVGDGGGGGGGNHLLQGTTGVTSLVLHPDKLKTQVLSMSLSPSSRTDPSSLKMHSTSTHKVQCVCAGSSSIGGYSDVTDSGVGARVFSRSTLSADGRMVVCGTTASNDHGYSRIRMWDSQTGHSVPSPLSDLPLPHPVRSLSWHPKQHVLAVAMVGPGASVIIYCGQRESAEKAVATINRSAATSLATAIVEGNTARSSILGKAQLTSLSESMESIDSDKLRASGQKEAFRLWTVNPGISSSVSLSERGIRGGGTDDKEKENKMVDLPAVKESIRNLRSEKAREILEKVRAAKGQ